jgi:Dolichyl-phosphate-mannose-protein mannosyltransferase
MRARLAVPGSISTLLVAATFILASALRYPSLFEPRWYGDEGIFASVAENVRHGHMLYSGAWDNKPPLIYFTYALIQAAFGTKMLPLHLVATLVALATQASVVVTAALIFGRLRAAVAGTVCALLLGTPLLEGNLAMTETFMILPTSLAVLVFAWSERRSRASPVAYVTIGALIGVAAAYKQVAIFDGLAIAVTVCVMHDAREECSRRRLVAWMAVGFLVPQVALAFLFLATGAFGAYWYAVVGSLGLYARLGPPVSGLKRLGEILPPLIVVAWLLRTQRRGDAAPLRRFPVLWRSFAAASVTASSFAFPHYLLQGVPPLALTAAAIPISGSSGRNVDTRLMLAASVLIATLVLHAQFWSPVRDRAQFSTEYYETFFSRESGSTSRQQYEAKFDASVPVLAEITRTVKADGAGKTAYAWSDQPWLYAQADLTNSTRYFTSYLGTEIPGARSEILRALSGNPPVYIVISDDAYAPFPELNAFVASRYSLIRAQDAWRLYRLSTAQGKLPIIGPSHPTASTPPSTRSR